MSSGATFVKIDKMKHSPKGDYSLVIEGNIGLVPLFQMYLALLFPNTFTILICVFQIPLKNLSFLLKKLGTLPLTLATRCVNNGRVP